MNQQVLPFNVSLSFELLINQYKERLVTEDNSITKAHLQNLLSYLEKYPKLSIGIENEEEFAELKEPIDLLLGDLFPQALTLNEIKAVSIPFHQWYFNHTQRFLNILNDAGENFKLELINFTDDELYIMACNVILGAHYKLNTGFQRPFNYVIPDKNGVVKTYKLTMNADFISINPTERAKEISENDIDLLLQNYDNIAVWKDKFPPNSWEIKGFMIDKLIDVTPDTVISEMKSNMLGHSVYNSTFEDFELNFKRLFNDDSVQLGFTAYDKDSNSFVTAPGKPTHSFILNKETSLGCESGLCKGSYEKIINKQDYLAIADVQKVAAIADNSVLKIYAEQGVKSCIITPIVSDNELLGILELVSLNKNALNTINANKLDDILPYLIQTAKRSVQESENHIKAIIQNECTSIHPTVLWKFEEEAKQFLVTQLDTGKAFFNDVVFDYVYPLFGQIDIIGSSNARNNAIQADFIMQLNLVENIFKEALAKEKLSFYEQMIFRIQLFSKELKASYTTASEEQLLYFLNNEINPVMSHIKSLSKNLAIQVAAYEETINSEIGVIYNKRKDYEDTVQRINEKMALIIDAKQKKAQKNFPHFFERFKTDGIEHNMYIGSSLVKNKSFDKVYLNNLRLWQLITMCEMENEFYDMHKELPLQLDCASLLLVFSNSLSIRYRVDEKRFDVDGSYNARYEIIKKRIDKAHIKGSDERVTQKGKLVIVYSQKKDEHEYLRYINFLQSKNYLKKEIELVELEDLQGVVGLKAIRVNVNYNLKSTKITYDDLVKEIEK